MSLKRCGGSDQMTDSIPSLQRSLPDVVAEYDLKAAAIPAALAAFEQAGNDLKTAASIGGTWGQINIEVGRPGDHAMKAGLLKSAWLHVYAGLNIEVLASPREKKAFELAMTSPPPFTLDNIRATFGRYIKDPRGSILRALAEVFCDLDPAYKSHDKVKVGVAGLPKRIILGGVTDYGWGRDRIQSVLNALAAYQGKPLVSHQEIRALLDDGDALLETRTIEKPQRHREPDRIDVVGRGIRLKRFQNGNGHLFFEPDTLKDINRALAEFYGDVLADCAEEKPDKLRPGTAVAKDLQYYPTPVAVVERIMADLYIRPGQWALDPSCGCGRLLAGLRKAGAGVVGIEVDAGRAAQARAQGFDVMHANFLETQPVPLYDYVVMNPPFYGRHYAKHVEHAMRFLKPGGRLTAILPCTARYDHGLVDGKWDDLPVGSFAESGTNINTSVLTKFAPAAAQSEAAE
jgi:hypothetical protein